MGQSRDGNRIGGKEEDISESDGTGNYGTIAGGVGEAGSTKFASAGNNNSVGGVGARTEWRRQRGDGDGDRDSERQ